MSTDNPIPKTLSEACEFIASYLEVFPRSQEMPLGDAIGSVLARDATAPAGLPRFDNAAMDGFAVRSADLTAGETGSDLKVTAVIAAGEIGFHEIGPGQAARIMTGAMIPKGADRVVVQENARMNGDRVRVFTSASDKPRIRRAGMDQLLAALVSAAATTI
jgi:molybdopterin molybdotransferase